MDRLWRFNKNMRARLCLMMVCFAALWPTHLLALNESQQATLEAVSDYFNDLTKIKGDFIQQAGLNSRASGTFYISKPGKIRFDYNPPSGIEVVSDGSIVLVKDKSIGSEDVYTLAQTPLKFLVSEDFDLARDTNVSNVYIDAEQVIIEIKDAKDFDVGKLTMVFSGYDYTLLQWSILDNQGKETTVFVDNLEDDDNLSADLFKIDYNSLKRYKSKN